MPKLPRPTFIARQSARPHGVLGRAIGKIMVGETAAANDTALEMLAPKPDDDILEIGFGPGRSVEKLTEAAPDGRVYGIDHSETMLAAATRRNQAGIRAERISLQRADSSAIPHADNSFDKILSVHTIYFWDHPDQDLAEIARVLRPGGRFVLAYTPDGAPTTQAFPEGVYRFYSAAEIEQRLARSGLRVEDNPTRRLGKQSIGFAVATKTP